MTNSIGQLFTIGISGHTLTPDEVKFITQNDIGGVILFDRNIKDPEQLHTLCTQIQNLRHNQPSKLPLFISIDMEGGRVLRLKAPFTKWPALAKIGQLNSTSVAFQFAHSMGDELRAVGINLDFAPCVDIFTNPQNKVIGDRSLSSDAETVSRLASALVRGYIKAHVLPCAKHFPGHGNTLVDSHDDLPVEEADLALLQERELQPFKKVFRARLDMVMTAHIRFSKIDSVWPVTLSEKFLKDILRNDLRYRGLVISDDLDMKALSKNYDVKEIPVRALKAGCDLLLYCNNPSSPPLGLEAVRKALASDSDLSKQAQQSLVKLTELKKEFLKQPDPLPFEEAAEVIGRSNHVRLAKAIEDGSVPADLLTT